MGKLLLVSIVIATVVIPITAAGDPSPRRALRKALTSFVLFNAFYFVAILYIYPRLP